jgi:3-oxo-5-alpha-steroid 4-dehydrogenase 1
MQAYLDTAATVARGQLPVPEERQLVEQLAAALVGSFVLAAAALLLGIEAPYGRYSKSGWGCMLNGKLAWVVQECPNLLAVGWALALPEGGSSLQQSPASACLLAMFTLHYINRTLIFPLRIRGGKPTPFIPFIMATLFCTANGYMQARSLTALYTYESSWLTDPRFICGTVGNTAFCAAPYGKTPNICQDRLGTNVGNAGNNAFFPAGALLHRGVHQR